MLRHLINLLLCFLPPSRLFGLRRRLWRIAGVSVADGASICGGGWIYGPGVVSVGARTWLSPGVTLYSHPDVPIFIGSNCDLGHEICILTGSHVVGKKERRAGPGTAGAVKIGDGCWIGARCTILGGVTIGEGSVVAAGSVVTRDMPPNTLAMGVPAKAKRMLA